MIKKTMARALVVLAMTVGAVGLAAAPAQAAYSACPSNRFCVWLDHNGGGQMYYWGPEFYNTCTFVGGAFHDAVSSIRSTFPDPWKVTTYSDSPCKGVTTSTYSFFQGWVGFRQDMNLVGSRDNVTSSFKVWQ